MEHKYLNIIGMMTGTSMDGIDISLVQTNGYELKRLNKNFFHKYNKETKKFLMSVLDNSYQYRLHIFRIYQRYLLGENL